MVLNPCLLQRPESSWSGRRSAGLNCSMSAPWRNAGNGWRSRGRKRSSEEPQWRRRGGSSSRRRGSDEFESFVFRPWHCVVPDLKSMLRLSSFDFMRSIWNIAADIFGMPKSKTRWGNLNKVSLSMLHAGAAWGPHETFFGEKPSAGAENKTLGKGLSWSR